MPATSPAACARRTSASAGDLGVDVRNAVGLRRIGLVDAVGEREAEDRDRREVHHARSARATGGVEHVTRAERVGPPDAAGIAPAHGDDRGGVDDEIAAGGMGLPVTGLRDVPGDDRARRIRAHVHAPDLGAERREPARQRRADEAAGARDEDAARGHRASGRTSAPVSAARSAGASSISSPRRPAETKTVSCSLGALVQERRQALALPERADAARDVAGDLLGPRHVGHRGALADRLEIQLVGGRDDRDREVVADADHERLEDSPRIKAQHFRRLARVGRRARVVVVLVQGVGDARGLGGAGGRGLAAGHRRPMLSAALRSPSRDGRRRARPASPPAAAPAAPAPACGREGAAAAPHAGRSRAGRRSPRAPGRRAPRGSRAAARG